MILHVLRHHVAAIAAASACVGAHAADPADLVLRNGTIVTVDDGIGTARALAVRGDRIAAVGDEAAIAPLIGPETTVIELEGRLVIPGFIEGHGHFVGLGQALMNLDLTGAASWAVIIEIVAEAVKTAKPGEWIVGRGWHQEKWQRTPGGAVEGFPTHHELSAVSPENPVLLTHASGHASFANQRAMELAGISGATPDPPGGEILRDESGQPIGIFRERASDLVEAAHAEATGGARRCAGSTASSTARSTSRRASVCATA